MASVAQAGCFMPAITMVHRVLLSDCTVLVVVYFAFTASSCSLGLLIGEA